MNNIGAKIEALLFIYGEPTDIEKLGKVLGLDEEQIMSEIGALAERLRERGSGLSIIFHDSRVQLTTSSETADVVRESIAGEIESGLTPASVETLSIVAYLGPCTRALIEHIRGVNSSFILRSLMMRGLIERKQNPKPSQGYLYQASFDFLKHIGINTPEELPEYEKYRTLIESLSGDENEVKDVE